MYGNRAGGRAGGLKMVTKGTADGTVRVEDTMTRMKSQGGNAVRVKAAAAAAAFLHRKRVSFQKFEES